MHGPGLRERAVGIHQPVLAQPSPGVVGIVFGALDAGKPARIDIGDAAVPEPDEAEDAA